MEIFVTLSEIFRCLLLMLVQSSLKMLLFQRKKYSCWWLGICWWLYLFYFFFQWVKINSVIGYFQIPELKEIILIGFYQSSESLSKFIQNAQNEFNIPIRYTTFKLSFWIHCNHIVNHIVEVCWLMVMKLTSRLSGPGLSPSQGG